MCVQLSLQLLFVWKDLCLEMFGCVELKNNVGPLMEAGADTGFMKGGGTVYETLPEAVHRGV